MNYRQAVEDIESRTTGKDDITIDTVSEALESLQRPDEDYKVVLIGGTNGKGSTAEMLSELLQNQGKQVGCFKSPHLTSIRERVRINNQKISQKEFLELYHRLERLEQDLSFFEFMTLMAYLYFSKKDVDYAVLEVGMGGRLDATNAANPVLSVITNVALDHTQYLGDSIEKIAREKAGIIPDTGKIITSEELESINKIARERNSEIIRPYSVETLENGKYLFENQEFEIPVEGSFQKQNLENSLAAIDQLESTPEDIETALSDLSCPGRMEKISEDPEIILDGAHNPPAIEKAIEDLPDDFTCIFNALETKNSASMIKTLEKKASKILFTNSGARKSSDPSKLEEKCSKPSEVIEDPVKAVQKATENNESIVVTGSLYLVGKIKEKTLAKTKVRAKQTIYNERT